MCLVSHKVSLCYVIVYLLASLVFMTQSVCNNSNDNRQVATNVSDSNEAQVVDSHDEGNLTLESLEALFNIRFLANGKSYVTDTISVDDLSFVMYGNIPQGKIFDDQMYTNFDSIKLISPMDTSLLLSRSDELGGYFSIDSAFVFQDIIRILDLNDNNRKDFEIYSDMRSGNSGYSVYKQFILNRTNKSIFTKTVSYMGDIKE